MLLEARQRATILAALQFWREEMCPNGVEVMRPYLETVGCGEAEPLGDAEIGRLMERLRQGTEAAGGSRSRDGPEV